MIKCQKCSEENKPEEENSVEYLTELLTDMKKKKEKSQTEILEAKNLY